MSDDPDLPDLPDLDDGTAIAMAIHFGRLAGRSDEQIAQAIAEDRPNGIDSARFLTRRVLRMPDLDHDVYRRNLVLLDRAEEIVRGRQS